jgi:hypothetical protein
MEQEQQDVKESVMKMIQEEIDTMPVDGLNPEGIVSRYFACVQ